MSGEISGVDVGGGSFVTDFSVRMAVEPGVVPKEEPRSKPMVLASPFSNAGTSVFVDGPLGRIKLSEDQGDRGIYRATRGGYVPGVYTVTVVYAGRKSRSVSVGAPDIHTITSPVPFDTIEAGKPITVEWTRAVSAEEVVAETRDFVTRGRRADTGKVTIPPQGNPPRDDQFIRVWRVNRATVPGKLKGEFVIKIGNSVEPIIAQ
jgi:hypothetical protein